ncbi:MAG: transposase [Deltaproteobacteria bacterium]|jgi:hypothetical protein|nr:transposase [Deltaproteobacteria bacterium]MBT4644432.1 transposase [Deltaproteobacteria bacterium]
MKMNQMINRNEFCDFKRIKKHFNWGANLIDFHEQQEDVVHNPFNLPTFTRGVSEQKNSQSHMTVGIKPIRQLPQSPNMNCYSERFVGSIKRECLRKLIFFGKESLRKALSEYVSHYHKERNHQGKDNLLLLPDPKYIKNPGKIKC